MKLQVKFSNKFKNDLNLAEEIQFQNKMKLLLRNLCGY